MIEMHSGWFRGCVQSLWSIALACLHLCKGLLLLIPFLVHEVVLLVVILSVCVGFTALLSFFHEICWFRPLAADVQAVLALVFLTSLGEGATLVLRNSFIHIYFHQKKTQFPCLFKTIPLGFWFLNCLLALSQLYLGYIDAHPSLYFGNRETDEGIDPESLNATSTFLVLCSLSFFTYTLPRGTDWMEYRFRMSPAERHLDLGTRVYIAFFLVQAFLLAVYACPLVILAILCRFVEASPLLTFLGLILNGVGLGINLAQLEDRYIFRMRPMQPPFYAYENHLAARVNLFQYVLIPFVTLSYYGSGPISELRPGDQFLLYTILISIAFLQAAKSTCNDHYLKALRHLRGERVQRPLVALLPEPQVNPEDPGQEAPVLLPEDCPEEGKNENGNEDCNENVSEQDNIPATGGGGVNNDEHEAKNDSNLILENENRV